MNIYKLKKLFKIVLFILILTIILWLFKLSIVNAATFAPFDFSIVGNSNLPQDQWVDNGMSKILTVATSMQENNLNINERNYVEIFACVAGGPSWSSYITNDDLNGAFQNGAVNSLNTGISCKTTNQSYNGSIFKFYFKIYKWRIPSGADLYEVSSYWRFNSSEASLLLDIRDIKITDKDNFYDDSILVSNGKGQDIIINNGNATNKKLDDLNKKLTDETSPNLSGLQNSAGWLKPGPVDSILNLPLSLLNNLTTNLSKSCTAIDLPLPFVNKNLQLPCLNTIYSKINGVGVFLNSIGVIASAFIIYEYLRKLYIRIDKILNFDNVSGWGDI